MNHDLGFEEALIRLRGQPERVVSLVPSYTQSLFDLGFGDTVVGITDFCTHPVGRLDGVARIGGPQNFRIDTISALHPDLVLANQEENARDLVLGLRDARMNVWLSFPRSVQETFTFLADLVKLYADENALTRLRLLEASFDWAVQAAVGPTRLRTFCPIWQEAGPTEEVYWMTFNQDTYSSDLLNYLGCENVFSRRERRYPLAADLGAGVPEASGDRDTRYPRVTLADVLAAQPELILLPDEPFNFDEESEKNLRLLLAETPAVREDRVWRVDGRWITWCGTCIGEAAVEIGNLMSLYNGETQ